MARNINELHPRLQEAAAQIKKQFPDIGIAECFRSVEEQEALYAQGRTKPGAIVTNVRGNSYSSQHQWGIAFDFFYNVKGQEYADVKYFQRVGAYGKSIGLGWGGDWESPVDMPHLYLPDWGSTTGKLKAQYGTFEAFKKTWGSEVANAGTGGGNYMFECPTVKKSSRGNAVRLLQELLYAKGCNPQGIDGILGSKSEAALKEYQRKHGLVPDGIAGKLTWGSLIDL